MNAYTLVIVRGIKIRKVRSLYVGVHMSMMIFCQPLLVNVHNYERKQSPSISLKLWFGHCISYFDVDVGSDLEASQEISGVTRRGLLDSQQPSLLGHHHISP